MKTSIERSNAVDGGPASGTSRRGFLRGVGGVMAVGAIAPHLGAADGVGAMPFPISVSDRGVGLRQQLGVFQLARHCGVAGVEVDLGRLGASASMTNRLLDPAGRQQFLEAADTAGVAITSLALTAFVDQPFSSHPKAEAYAADLLYLMREMNVGVGYLPLDVCDDAAFGATVGRLKNLSATAERHGLTIAVTSELPAARLADLLAAVDSPAVRAAVVAGPGQDALADLAAIGVRRVAQVRYRHDNENDASADLAALAGSLKSAGWAGGFVIDRPAHTAGEAAADLSSAVGRLRRSFSPTLT